MKESRKDPANREIVTLAVYLLGGDAHWVDTEDIAKKANELAPGRFTWRNLRAPNHCAPSGDYPREVICFAS